MGMSVDQALRKARSLSPDEAEALYRDMLARFPANKRIREELQALARPRLQTVPREALESLIALYRQGRVTGALDLAAELLIQFPNSEILNNVTGAINAAAGHYEQAIQHYDKAIELAPDYFEALNNRGIALNEHNCPEEAVLSFDAAITLFPDNTEAYMNRGIALRRLKRLDEALASGSKAIRLNPVCAEAYNSRGSTLAAVGRYNEALADFDKAITLKPNYPQAFVNRGNALLSLGRLEESVANYDRAIAIAPGQVNAHNNRGSALRRLKRLDEALASHRNALKFAPGSALAAAEARNLQSQMCLWSKGPFDAGGVELGTGDDAFPPFYMLGFEDSPQRQLLCARNWTSKEYGAAQTATFRAPPADGKIRIGYFSADFHNHATMYLMARLFELHDRSRFEVHAFSYGPDTHDEMRRRLVDTVDAFHQVGDLADDAVAALARSKAIDIAVDLKGHTSDGRLGIFARRAAPVQISYLGYPGTLGADFIDYIVADEITIPAEYQRFYSEKVLYLPNCYQPNDNRREVSNRTFSRAELGLPASGFVFCCFNNNYKITPAEFDIWMRLLAKVEGSVLWLLKDNEWAAENLRCEAQARGISPDRLAFAERMPTADHLARHCHADLFLDTFAVNAHTTASDALWAGVPVLTKIGDSFVARVAGSLLHALDVPELITRSPEVYEHRAIEIATNPLELAALKAKVTRNRLTAPLFDTERYARDIEAVYERLLTRQ